MILLDRRSDQPCSPSRYHGIDGALMSQLDDGNRYVHAAVRSVATRTPLPAPPHDPRWLQRAEQHGVLSILAAHLPPSTDVSLDSVRRRQTAQHLRSMGDLDIVASALDGAAVEWLIFKGPVLSEIVYQTPGTRSYSDLDILIRPQDLDEVMALLRRAGATPVWADWADKRRAGFGETELLLPYGTVLDLHWHVLNNHEMRRGFSVDTHELLAGSREITLNGRSIRTFGVSDTLLHVALHACKSGGDKLRWLLDTQQCLLRIDAPAAEVLDRARTLGLELALRTMLSRVEKFVDSRQPLDMPVPPRSQRMWLAADALAMSRRPPGSGSEGRLSAAVLANSVRRDPKRSWITLMTVLPGLTGSRARDRWNRERRNLPMPNRQQVRIALERASGLYIRKVTPRGVDLQCDMAQMPGLQVRMVFDVGAHHGESAEQFVRAWPSAQIHCFEPTSESLEALRERMMGRPQVVCRNIALGAHDHEADLYVKNGSTNNSLQANSIDAAEEVLVRTDRVSVRTLDSFCVEHGIEHIDFLKVDTEGGDLDVLNGASAMLRRGAVAVVQVEVGLHPDNHKHIPLQVVMDNLEKVGYRLFGLYEQVPEFPGGNLRRANAVFIAPTRIPVQPLPED